MSRVDFFRRVGAEAEARLRVAGLATRGHVGADLRDEWLHRLSDLPPDVSLDWVAFDFPGLPMWDVHVGVPADFGRQPPRCTVGLHVLEPLWPAALRILARGDARLALALEVEAVRPPAIHEVQLNDPWTDLDLGRLDAEVERFAARAAELYRLLEPCVARLVRGDVSSP